MVEACRYVGEFMLKTGVLGQFKDVMLGLKLPGAPETLESLGTLGSSSHRDLKVSYRIPEG